MSSFVSQLKQRRVYRVAIGYAIAAWLAVQIAATVLPAFHAPEFILPVLIVLLGVGFPVALVLAWAFDVTPSGIEKTPEGTGAAAAKNLRYAWALAGFGLLIAAAGVGAYWLWHYPRTNRAAAPDVASQDAVREKGAVAPQLPAISEKSIAVLPFENLSSDKENAYFAEGIQDEILTRLSKISALKVISRTSTAKYKSAPDNLREIGKQLGVADLLEGSVQKISNSVHINVQLIRVATDEHVWAESYNRKLDDVFLVEGEVAGAIAQQLNAKLSGSEKQELAQKPTDNPAAYEAYLRGLTEFWQLTLESRSVAVQSFEEAVRLDPKFALAWATLSRVHSVAYLQNIDRSVSRSAAAEKALAEAVLLQPQLPETQLARAWYQYCILRDYNGAREMLKQLRMIWPSNAQIVELLGYVSARMGEYQRSTDYLDEATGLNPRDAFVRNQAVQTRLATRDFAAALRLVNEALQIWTDDVNLEVSKAAIFEARGDLTQSQASVDRLTPRLNENDIIIAAVAYQAKLRRTAPPAAALQYCESKAGKTGTGLLNLHILQNWADLLALSGDQAKSAAVFAKLRESTEVLLQQQPDNGGLFQFRAHALAGLGERDAALNAANRAIELAANDGRAHGAAKELKARLLARFGDKDNAIPLLQHLSEISYDGLEAAPLTPALLRLDPDFDALRGDPRFEKLCQAKQP